MLLKDKVLILSGIGPGLGVKLALEAAREGAHGLALASRSPQKLDDAEHRIREFNTHCRLLKVPTDITDPAQCRRLAEHTVQTFGRIDGLVNSAFVYGSSQPVADGALTDWTDVLNTNLLGTLQMSQAVLPTMKAQGHGAIVNVNTSATVETNPGEGSYAASKAALIAATRHFAREVGRHGIRVNTARLGWLWGVPVQKALAQQAQAEGRTVDDIKRRIEKKIALNRMMTDDECARAALFLVSDYAVAVSGATLDINGGEFMP